MAEKMKEYSFKVHFNERDSGRFEDYVRETGMKKLGVIRKAILRYLDEEEQKAGN